MDDPVQLVWYEKINHGFASVHMQAWFDHKREYGVIDVHIPRASHSSYNIDPDTFGHRLNCYIVKSPDFRNTISMAQQLWNETNGFQEMAEEFRANGKKS